LVRLQRVVFCAPRRSARAKGSAVPTDGPELRALAPGELVVCARYGPQTQIDDSAHAQCVRALCCAA
jgi:hypothetical protein